MMFAVVVVVVVVDPAPQIPTPCDARLRVHCPRAVGLSAICAGAAALCAPAAEAGCGQVLLHNRHADLAAGRQRRPQRDPGAADHRLLARASRDRRRDHLRGRNARLAAARTFDDDK